MASPTLKTLLPAYQKRYDNHSKRSLADRFKIHPNPSAAEQAVRETKKKEADAYLKHAAVQDHLRRYGGEEENDDQNAQPSDEPEPATVVETNPPPIMHTPPRLRTTTKYVPGSHTVQKVIDKLSRVSLDENDPVKGKLDVQFDATVDSKHWIRRIVTLVCLVSLASIFPLTRPSLDEWPQMFNRQPQQQQQQHYPTHSPDDDDHTLVEDAMSQASHIIQRAEEEKKRILQNAIEEANVIRSSIAKEADAKSQKMMDEHSKKNADIERLINDAEKKREKIILEAKQIREEAIRTSREVTRRTFYNLARSERKDEGKGDSSMKDKLLETRALPSFWFRFKALFRWMAGLGTLMGVVGYSWHHFKDRSISGGSWDIEVSSEPNMVRRRSVVQSPSLSSFSGPGSPDSGLLGWISPPRTFHSDTAGPGYGSFSTLEDAATPNTPRRAVRRSSRLSSSSPYGYSASS